jgi:hypothetical protein
MGPRNPYKDMLENVISPIACVSMNRQNKLKQMANETMFATRTLPRLTRTNRSVLWQDDGSKRRASS